MQLISYLDFQGAAALHELAARRPAVELFLQEHAVDVEQALRGTAFEVRPCSRSSGDDASTFYDG
jgi:hypothetical protein